MAKHPDNTVNWPETPVLLYVPQEWQSPQQKATQCVFVHDAQQNLLKLVDHENHENVIDVLDPEDIIGVSVQVNVLEGLADPRATSNENTGDNAPTTETLADTQGHAVLTIYAYPRRDPNHPVDPVLLKWCGMGKPHPNPHPDYQRPQGDERKKFGHRYAFHRHLKAVPSEDVGALNALVQAIQQAAGLQKERGRALVIVNPKSGPKQNAEEIYDNTVAVLLEQAGVEHDLLVTDHQGHAGEIVVKDSVGKDILDYSMLVSVGGDGIAFECLQGLRQRDDYKAILQKLTVGFVGAGTSNGMAMSIARQSHEKSSPLEASFLIAKGHTHTCDLSEYQTTQNTYWSFLTFSWAWISSIDVDSEVLRGLGPLRFDLWGVYQVLRMKPYRAKFSYLPVHNINEAPSMPALDKPVTEEWITEEDDFYVFWASHVTDAAENTYNSPPSQMNDGVFTIFIVRAKNASRFAMVKILLAMGNGSHQGMKGVEFIQCSAYRLEHKEGINDVDGEVVEAGPIQGKIMPSAMNIFCKK